VSDSSARRVELYSSTPETGVDRTRRRRRRRRKGRKTRRRMRTRTRTKEEEEEEDENEDEERGTQVRAGVVPQRRVGPRA